MTEEIIQSDESIKMDDGTATDLKNTVVEIERLENQIKYLRSEIKEIFDNAKSKFGFEPKIIRQILKLRKLDEKAKERLQQDEDVAKFLEEKINEV